MYRALIPGLLVALCLLSGCDLFREDSTIVATGLVLDGSLGQPAAGISVALRGSGGYGSYPAVATTQTNAEGRFRLEYDPGDYRSALSLHFNDQPYDSRFTAPWYGVMPGETSEQTTTVYRNTTLTVHARTETPLGEGDLYYLWLPTSGARNQSVTDTNARGNMENEVRLVVQRNGVTSEIIASVYCPVGVVTEHTIWF